MRILNKKCCAGVSGLELAPVRAGWRVESFGIRVYGVGSGCGVDTLNLGFRVWV